MIDANFFVIKRYVNINMINYSVGFKLIKIFIALIWILISFTWL
jgi:hypothetical protein